MLVHEDSDDEVERKEPTVGEDGVTKMELAEMNQMAKISLSTVAGFSSPKTMKLRGKMDGQDVVVMVDT